MGTASWGTDPEFFGPRHAFREELLRRELGRRVRPGGLHLECAAGVGSLSLSLARAGYQVVAADSSLRSLAFLADRAAVLNLSGAICPVAADITSLPFRDLTFGSATTAETLEHIPSHVEAVRELSRVLERGGWLAGTVPAGPEQWSAWDDWAGHLRRYTRASMEAVLRGAGLDPSVRRWGWPMTRLYDGLFLKGINRRRLRTDGPVGNDPALRAVGRMGRSRMLVRAVTAILSVDRLFPGVLWGVGLLFSARKPAR